MPRRLRGLILFSGVLLLVAVRQASADLLDVVPEIGVLRHWSVFTLGAEGTRSEFGGNAVIQGDVGVAGNGDIALNSTATIHGNLYYHSGGTVKTSPDASITGMQVDDKDVELDTIAATAMNAMRRAVDLRQTFFAPPNLQLSRNQNFTATGAPGETVVLKLGNFVLGGHSTFTLEGTASTTFIINVDRKFSLAGNASIVLGSDVQWSNVLFNICGKDSAVSLGGSSRFAGILMANRRGIHVTNNANVTGELIANRVMLSSKSFNADVNVGNPSVVSQ